MCVAECCGPKVGSAIVPDHNTSAVLQDGCGGTAATIGKYSVSFEKPTLAKLIKNLVHDHIHKSPRHGLRNLPTFPSTILYEFLIRATCPAHHVVNLITFHEESLQPPVTSSLCSH